jgi:hypothetical protein
LKTTTPSPAVIVARASGIIWFALAALVVLVVVKSLVVAPNEGRLEERPVVSAWNLAFAGYAALNAFVAFRLARLKRWAFIALPMVVLPWILYAGTFLLSADLAVSMRRLVATVAVLALACSLSALGAYPFLKADGLLRRGA